MRGEIDFSTRWRQTRGSFIEAENRRTAVFPFLRNYVYAVVFNSNRRSFDDARVRRALNYAVDRSDIVEQALQGHGTASSGPAWPQHWAYDTSRSRHIAYDPARATALLDAAGSAADSRAARTSPSAIPTSRVCFRRTSRSGSGWHSSFSGTSQRSAWTCNSKPCRSTSSTSESRQGFRRSLDRTHRRQQPKPPIYVSGIHRANRISRATESTASIALWRHSRAPDEANTARLSAIFNCEHSRRSASHLSRARRRHRAVSRRFQVVRPR